MLQLETIDNAYSFHSYDDKSARIIKPQHNIHSTQSAADALVEISSTTFIYKNQLETDFPAEFIQFDNQCIENLIKYNADIYLIGTGSNLCFPAGHILQNITKNKYAIDFMDTGAACRTFNILTAEYRNVAVLIFFK